jgi:pyruvate,water dikinase
MAVVVQKMVFPEKSGIMFTADPVTNNRNIVTIDAGFGLGEAFVSGVVTPDSYKINQSNIITNKDINRKEFAIKAKVEGGTYKEELDERLKETQVLTEKEILNLTKLGRNIQAHYNKPQDIEWCIIGEKIYITQTRPITSLFHVPKTPKDNRYHLFISFNHVQVMTDRIKPLGQSLLRYLFPFGKDAPQEESMILVPAGSWLYLDITYLLTTGPLSKVWPKMLENADVLIAKAVKKVIHSEKFKNNNPLKGMNLKLIKFYVPLLLKVLKIFLINNNEQALNKINKIVENKIEIVQNQINSKESILEKLKTIRQSVSELLLNLIKQILPYLITGIASYKILENLLANQQGDNQLVQKLMSGLKGNITTQMGLKIGDIADMLRGKEELIQILKNKPADQAFNLIKEKGDQKLKEAIDDVFIKYGMRGIGEIDITKKRYIEDPNPIASSILNNLATYDKPKEHREKYEQLTREAKKAAEEINKIMKKSRFGWLKAALSKKLISNIRKLMPLREHPKYTIVSCFQIYKKVLLEAGDVLKEKNLIDKQKDIYYLSLSEIIETIEINTNFKNIIKQRKTNYEYDKKLTPPRVITSEGEIIKGNYQKSGTENVIVGSPVSAGIVEGRAKVVYNPDNVNLKKGDILVVPFTDPGWTPLFINAAGLVMEVGGLMTHGAVVAREYGIPAVVGVEKATEIISDGEKIRVDGDLGTIEIINNNKK